MSKEVTSEWTCKRKEEGASHEDLRREQQKEQAIDPKVYLKNSKGAGPRVHVGEPPEGLVRRLFIRGLVGYHRKFVFYSDSDRE